MATTIKITPNTNSDLYILSISAITDPGVNNAIFSIHPIVSFQFEVDTNIVDGGEYVVPSSGEPLIMGNDPMLNFIIVDIKSGFSWSNDGMLYDNWLLAVESSINSELTLKEIDGYCSIRCAANDNMLVGDEAKLPFTFDQFVESVEFTIS